MNFSTHPFFVEQRLLFIKGKIKFYCVQSLQEKSKKWLESYYHCLISIQFASFSEYERDFIFIFVAFDRDRSQVLWVWSLSLYRFMHPRIHFMHHKVTLCTQSLLYASKNSLYALESYFMHPRIMPVNFYKNVISIS